MHFRLQQREIKHGFPYAEIVKITNNFEKVIGEGGSGNLYYGRLKYGHELAVMVLKNSLSQGTKELLAKVKLLVTVHHKCLVPFVGYCEEGGRLILLYENMSGGNLRQLLSGLDYLHSGCNPPIIHREVKTSNILLNAKMEAKVTDFAGTTVQTWSPRRAMSIALVWFSSSYDWISSRRTSSVADLKLRRQYDVNSIWKVADIAMSCTSQPSHSRPHMSDSKPIEGGCRDRELL
ncbi:Senescence-induced receptor-like serine/threonine-protein kinase [Nymphaea thermarum]|nr:Senescence-induced receptor-like serine/threonine-protein kinase [Nymphaea thermarum]